jgi:hypothetical protein
MIITFRADFKIRKPIFFENMRLAGFAEDPNIFFGRLRLGLFF